MAATPMIPVAPPRINEPPTPSRSAMAPMKSAPTAAAPIATDEALESEFVRADVRRIEVLSIARVK